MQKATTRRYSAGYIPVAALLELEEERTLTKARLEVDEELYIEYLLHEDHEEWQYRDDEYDFSY